MLSSDSYGAASEDYAVPAADSYGAASEDAPDVLDSYGEEAAAADEAPVEAPADNYGAAAEEAAASDVTYDEYDASDIPADQAAYGGAAAAPAAAPAAAGDLAAAASGEDMGLKMLMTSVPGTPGEDYPIYAEAPETAFTCDGQVDGGYYADPEAECQVFHICTADGKGGLAKYSFLCPNGTIFNQNYFICDWWFNFDCAEAAAIASEKNSELAAAREAASEAVAASASNAEASYAAPADTVEPAASAEVNSLYGAPELDEAASDLAGYEQASYSRRR